MDKTRMALHFELVTPAKQVRSEEVHMVVVPGSESAVESVVSLFPP